MKSRQIEVPDTKASPRSSVLGSAQILKPPGRLVLVICAMVAWFLVAELVTEGWYRWHESRAVRNVGWDFRWPDGTAPSADGVKDFRENEVAPSIKEILCFDKARAASWRDFRGNNWTAVELEWKPDRALNGIDVLHNPTACMPAAGFTLVRDFGEQIVQVNGIDLVLHRYEFSRSGRAVFVFTTSFKPLQFSARKFDESISGHTASRIRQAMNGNRINPLKVIQFAVAGPSTEAEAQMALIERLKAGLRKQS